MDNANVVDMMQFHRFLLGETSVRLERFGEAVQAKECEGEEVARSAPRVGIIVPEQGCEATSCLL